jgi:hypothetical protein
VSRRESGPNVAAHIHPNSIVFPMEFSNMHAN